MGPSNLNVNIIDNTISVAEPETGIIFLQGVTKRGPVNDPKDLVTSERQFKILFGGEDNPSDFSLLALRMINRGAVLRINRITDGTQDTAGSAPIVKTGGLVTLFTLIAKYAGVDYNNLVVNVKAASNGKSNYFDLHITHTTDTLINEYYPNLTIVGQPTAANCHYLDDVKKKSQVVDVLYADLSAQTGQLNPVVDDYAFTGGLDGGTVDLADYVGVKADGTGFYAFDGYDDSAVLACPDLSDTDFAGLGAAGLAYAAGRGDMVFAHHVDNSNITTTTILAERGSGNSPYIMYFSGGLKILHPISADVYEISELADILATLAEVHNKYGAWRSFTGQTFGVLPNTLGVVNNFGTPASFADLKILANNQVNMVVRRNNQTYLNDDYTGMSDPSVRNFASVMFMVLYVTKALRPTLEKFLGYPNTFSTWEQIYFTVKPFLDMMVKKEAWYSYQWIGDQFATSLNNLQINSQAEVLEGKYKVQLQVIAVPPLKNFTLDFVLDNGLGAVTSDVQ